MHPAVLLTITERGNCITAKFLLTTVTLIYIESMFKDIRFFFLQIKGWVNNIRTTVAQMQNMINKLKAHQHKQPWRRSTCLYRSWKTSSNSDRQFTDYINACVKNDTETIMVAWHLKMTALFLSWVDCGGALLSDQGSVTQSTKCQWEGFSWWKPLIQSRDGKTRETRDTIIGREIIFINTGKLRICLQLKQLIS